MGGVLTGETDKPPTFFVWALQDMAHAPLAKVQVIKGWVDQAGAMQERVIDVACGDNTPTAPGETCQTTGSVNLQDCTWGTDTGAREIKAWWQDPDYDAALSTFYYVRVVQNPTCRWSTYDALRLNVDPPEGVPAAVQEMAWASPIWIKPAGG